MVALSLRTANNNFHNIVVITQIRGVIRSFWGHNKTHFSFGIGNILPDPDSDDSPDIKLKEDDPTSVDFYFLKTGKSKGEGVLTHGDTFKFTKNNMNRQETIHYYTCAQKLTYKCTPRAIITCEVDVDEDGKDVVKLRLVEVATPEVGG